MPPKSDLHPRTALLPPARISMQEVASLAGVSRSAVSLALRSHPSIPAQTQQRIFAAARQLGYRKNPLVAALMSVRRTRASGPGIRASLALMSPHFPAEAWRLGGPLRRFYFAALARAAELGFSLEEFSLADPSLRPERLRALLAARGVHGLLVAPLPGEQSRLEFDPSDYATIGLGLSVKEPAIDRVADDHSYAAELAFAHCLALGYQRIGLAVAADISRRLEHRWWSGFLLAQQVLPPRARIPALMPPTRDAIPAQLNTWIARHQIDVVIFVLRHEEKMACAPDRVGLVSLSVNDGSGKVAGVRQNERRIGEDAIDLLVAKLHRWETGPGAPPRIHLVRGHWVNGLTAPGPGLPRRWLV